MLHPPSWQKDALPTGRGWAHPKTGELLKATRLSTADINDYLGIPKRAAPAPAPAPAPVPDVHEEPAGGMETAVAEGDQMEMLLEADPINLNNMTKLELETYGRTKGIELDRRKSKADLINTLNEAG
jgi:hypothetical protein